MTNLFRGTPLVVLQALFLAQPPVHCVSTVLGCTLLGLLGRRHICSRHELVNTAGGHRMMNTYMGSSVLVSHGLRCCDVEGSNNIVAGSYGRARSLEKERVEEVSGGKLTSALRESRQTVLSPSQRHNRVSSRCATQGDQRHAVYRLFCSEVRAR